LVINHKTLANQDPCSIFCMSSREGSFLAPNGGGLESAQQLAQETMAALVSLDCVLKRRNEALEQQIKAQDEEILKLSLDKERLEKSLEGERRCFEHKREELWRHNAELQADTRLRCADLGKLEQSHSQTIKAQKKEIATLGQEKRMLEQDLQQVRQNFATKRAQLWGEIAELQAALASLKGDVGRMERSQCLMESNLEEQRQQAGQLGQQIQGERRRYADTINRLLADVRGVKAERDQLQQNVEHLEKEMEEQNAALEQERQSWNRRGTDNRTMMGSNLSSSLEKVMPHLRGLLEAYEQEQGGVSAATQTNDAEDVAEVTEELETTANSDLAEQLREQKRAFERERAQLLEQASDTAKTQQDIARRNLAEREGVLTCPISLELFDNPVVTECCGKTFSSSGLRQALMRSSTCPFCRQRVKVFHANRDVAMLVELHRAERSIMGLPDSTTLDSDGSASRAAEVVAHGSSESRVLQEFNRRRANDSNPCQSQHREDRLERLRARSEVPHRPESTPSNPRVTEITTPVVHRSRAARNQEIRNRLARRFASRRARLNAPPTPSGADSHREVEFLSSPATRAASSALGNSTRASTAALNGQLGRAGLLRRASSSATEDASSDSSDSEDSWWHLDSRLT